MFFRSKFKNKLIRPNLRTNRRVGDIHASKTLPPVLNLKKQKQLYISFSVVGGLIFLTALGWFIYGTFIRAEKAQFYPTACLGGWQNPQNAEGKPDLDEGAPAEDFSSKNSSVLQNAISELYCGGFKGDIPQDTEPKRAVLKFSWALKLPETAPPQPSSQQEGNDSKIENSVPESANPETPLPGDSETPAPETQTPENSTRRLVNTAYAQEETPNTPDAPNSSNPSDIPVSPNLPSDPTPTGEIQGENNEQPAAAENTPPDSTATPNAENQNTETPPPSNLDTQNNTQIASLPIQPAEEFLEILYTLDGTSWKSLGKVNYFSWQNLEYEIPNFSWDDVSKIQFALKSTPLIDAQSTIFLDGLWIEIEYANFEEIEETGEIEKSSLLFGTLPDFDKDKFKVDEVPTHSCELAPFRQYLAPEQRIKFRILLKPTNATRSHRLVLGDLPHGVKGGLKQDKNGIIIELQSNDSPQRGSFGVVIVYQELKNRKLLSANEVSTTVCQFNLIIN